MFKKVNEFMIDYILNKLQRETRGMRSLKRNVSIITVCALMLVQIPENSVKANDVERNQELGQVSDETSTAQEVTTDEISKDTDKINELNEKVNVDEPKTETETETEPKTEPKTETETEPEAKDNTTAELPGADSETIQDKPETEGSTKQQIDKSEETEQSQNETINTEGTTNKMLQEQEANTKAKNSDFVIEDGVLKAYNGSDTKVVIPDTVSIIGENAFHLAKINEVVIPSSVTTIQSSAFSFSKIRTITIPDTVTSIENNIFLYCSDLITVILPNNLTKIPDGMFEQCENLRKIIIPDTVTEIGDSAFNSCHSLPNLNLPNGLTTIGSWAFYECMKIAFDSLPEGITSIGEGALMGIRINNLVIPSGLTRIEKGNFQDTDVSKLTIPESVTYIGESAFRNSKFSELVIPGSITYIGYGAFSECSNLSNVIMQEGVTTIDRYAFTGCRNLKQISIPNSVTSMGVDVFRDCNDNMVYTRNGDGTLTYFDTYFKLYCSKDSYAYSYGVQHNIMTLTPEDSNNILINSLVINKAKVELPINANIKLNLTTYPKDATNANITWVSSNESVAVVSDIGVITAMGGGMATITASAQDKGKASISCEISVPNNASYKIKYNLNGGNNSDTNPSYYASGIKLKLENAVRKGYIFKGWYLNKKKITSINKTSQGDITLDAKWEKIKIAKTNITKAEKYYYTIELQFDKVEGIDGYTVFYANNDKLDNAKEKNVASNKTKASLRSLDNKIYYVTVKAYKIDSAGNKIYGKSNKIFKIHIKNQWNFSIKYDLSGGQNVDTNPDYYVNGIKLQLSDPIRKGYKFVGWYKGNTKVTCIKKSSRENIKLKAKWKKIKLSQTIVKKATNNKAKQFNVAFEKVNSIDGYTIFYSKDKKLKDAIEKNVASNKKSATIKNLEKGSIYYVTVKAYKIDSAGNKIYGKSNQIVKVKIKK